MKGSHVFAVVIAGGLGLCIWAVATAQDSARGRPMSAIGQAGARAAQQAAQPASGTDFSGKVIVVSVRGGGQPRIIEKAHFQDIHGRRFLVGQEAKTTLSFPVGTPAHIAWDAVETFYVFETVAQFQQAMRQAMQQAQGTIGQVFGEFFHNSNGILQAGPTFVSTPGSLTMPEHRPIDVPQSAAGAPQLSNELPPKPIYGPAPR